MWPLIKWKPRAVSHAEIQAAASSEDEWVCCIFAPGVILVTFLQPPKIPEVSCLLARCRVALAFREVPKEAREKILHLLCPCYLGCKEHRLTSPNPKHVWYNVFLFIYLLGMLLRSLFTVLLEAAYHFKWALFCVGGRGEFPRLLISVFDLALIS